jgi:hypothetical protein
MDAFYFTKLVTQAVKKKKHDHMSHAMFLQYYVGTYKITHVQK